MLDTILADGDQAIFTPAFGVAIVIVQPGKLTGTGKGTVNGKKICIQGDEKNLAVPGCMYIAPPFVIPGTGTLKIAALANDQVAKTVTDSGKAVILKGSMFTAKFEVQSPAKDPSIPTAPPKPDVMSEYTGFGSFVSFNVKANAD
ncbi:hypothetical protein [Mucilaginibacter phyllosphaerae]|uniref:DUF2190 family protein n=1 Tax=Mucilaginibacter phyllosphaerae TaxID=1812349 RepID=A0A4Y8ABX8_9SPHI|nr:hypothetical protein [Mucilaginibacter phyllosphaerae]MBB3969163.1 hypothetical protein [Mucilaginibacter phyllosphaerae]TEW66027.1 hypothetical protein E2R65_12955 [Mucilaginibacter phyllosphaerae]GGH06722.1 hypothetical protein GCM10007352_11060 [Mucilaginibacter phyllosphaerae]